MRRVSSAGSIALLYCPQLAYLLTVYDLEPAFIKAFPNILKARIEDQYICDINIYLSHFEESGSSILLTMS